MQVERYNRHRIDAIRLQRKALRHSMRKSFVNATIAATLLVIAAGCAARVPPIAVIFRPQPAGKLEVGKHSKEYVRGVLGTPSTVGTFDKNVWYYIGRRTERWAFFEESVIQQQIVAIYFDPDGQDRTHSETYDEGRQPRHRHRRGQDPDGGPRIGRGRTDHRQLGTLQPSGVVGSSRY